MVAGLQMLIYMLCRYVLKDITIPCLDIGLRARASVATDSLDTGSHDSFVEDMATDEASSVGELY